MHDDEAYRSGNDPLLGNNTETASAWSLMHPRARRFALLKVAQRLTENDRLIRCFWRPARGHDGVEVWQHRDTMKTYVRGLQTCGLIWMCPVCSQKITENRRREWLRVLGQEREFMWGSSGHSDSMHVEPLYYLTMATFTMHHELAWSLSYCMPLLKKAYRRLWSGRRAQKFQSAHLITGTIRGIEVTHGRAGWHPHVHCLLVTEHPIYPCEEEEMRDQLFDLWFDALRKEGNWCTKESGVFVERGDLRLIEYLDPSGVKHEVLAQDKSGITEVTKFPTKEARAGGLTLQGLLEAFADGDNDSGDLWREAQTVLRGTRHIATSKGLLERLKASDILTDDNAASREMIEVSDVLLAEIGYPDWRLIMRYGAAHSVLTLAAGENAQAAIAMLIADLRRIDEDEIPF